MSDDPHPTPRVLLGATGSVASIKIPALVQLLQQSAEVRVIATQRSLHFFNPTELGSVPVYVDENEWTWKKVSDPVLHIELRRWADILVIAPLSANTLAKVAHGLCDNLLTCVVRAWDYEKPFLVAPAMNTYMYTSPFTTQQLNTLQGFGVRVVDAISKTLACGDVGMGAMAQVTTIHDAVQQACRDAGFTRNR